MDSKTKRNDPVWDVIAKNYGSDVADDIDPMTMRDSAGMIYSVTYNFDEKKFEVEKTSELDYAIAHYEEYIMTRYSPDSIVRKTITAAIESGAKNMEEI